MAMDIKSIFFHVLIARRIKRVRHLINSFEISYPQALENGYQSLRVATGTLLRDITSSLVGNISDPLGYSLDDNSMLHFAVESGDIELVETLLSRGTDVGAQLTTSTQRRNGWTALHFAASKGSEEMVKLLLRHDVPINAVGEDGRTALYVAVRRGFPEIARLLLESGAHVNAACNSGLHEGCTPLHVAVVSRNPEVVSLLLEHGADVNLETKIGETALEAVITYFELPFFFSYQPHTMGHDIQMVAEILTKHIVRLKSGNSHISKKNVKLLSFYRISNFHNKCEKEVRGMKANYICHSTVNFFDILESNTKKLVGYFRNENVIQALESGNYKKDFPIYSNMIEKQYNTGRERRDFLQQGIEILYSFINNVHPLPYIYVEKIVGFLSDEDLSNVINSKPTTENDNPASVSVATTSVVRKRKRQCRFICKRRNVIKSRKKTKRANQAKDPSVKIG